MMVIALIAKRAQLMNGVKPPAVTLANYLERLVVEMRYVLQQGIKHDVLVLQDSLEIHPKNVIVANA